MNQKEITREIGKYFKLNDNENKSKYVESSWCNVNICKGDIFNDLMFDFKMLEKIQPRAHKRNKKGLQINETENKQQRTQQPKVGTLKKLTKLLNPYKN